MRKVKRMVVEIAYAPPVSNFSSWALFRHLELQVLAIF